MARLNVNPTRMELKRLKARLKTAERGHKLLKDKSDEMIRRFSILIKENKRLREQTDKDMANVFKEFAKARGLVSLEQIEGAFSMPVTAIEIDAETDNVMSVEVPKITVHALKSKDKFPYAFSSITEEIDYSSNIVSELIEKLLHLAEVEKATSMLAIEIERNKRRVNALEYVMIPQLQETIKYIRSKLDENERSATIRLMKVKTFISGE